MKKDNYGHWGSDISYWQTASIKKHSQDKSSLFQIIFRLKFDFNKPTGIEQPCIWFENCGVPASSVILYAINFIKHSWKRKLG